MRPTMNNDFKAYTAPKTNAFASLGSTLGSLVRPAIILGVIAVVGYFAGDSLGLWDLTKGQTIQTIQDHNANTQSVLDSMRGN